MMELARVLGIVALGSLLGGLARYMISGLVARMVGETFPWGTLVVNVSGAFGIGLAAAFATHPSFSHPEAWMFGVTGVLGSYTTVSSFSLQTLGLLREGQWSRAVSNVILSLLVCLAAVGVGMHVGALIVHGRLA